MSDSLPETSPHELPPPPVATNRGLFSGLLDRYGAGAADPLDSLECDIAPRELPDDTVVQGYRILRTLGAGGFGVTYLAQEESLNRQVVIKEHFPAHLCYRNAALEVCLAEEENRELYDWTVTSFLREVRLLASLSHPALTRVYSFFQANSTVYCVLQYVPGTSVADVFEYYSSQQRFVPQSALYALMLRVLDALDCVHSRHLLHRDIKPDNILIDTRGFPRLIDFGAACEQKRDFFSCSIVQTPGFSPVEQSSVDGAMGPWTDVYAFGATLYYLLTGTSLPLADRRVISDEIPPLSADPVLRRHYHPALLRTIEKAIRPLPEARYSSAAEWMSDLSAIS